MKRWTTIIGRVGTTLIAVSLALLLVSFVPSISTHTSGGSGPFGAGNMEILLYAQNFNPQQQIEGTVTAEGTVTVYILEITLELNFSPTTGFGYNFNSTDLEKLVEEQPEKIIWEHTVEKEDYKWSYSPTRVMNATVIAYGQPDSETAYFEHEVSLQRGLAPKDKVRTIAYGVAPIGAILAIPWLLNVWKERKQS
jgi:hypothetical protein